jgi:hypothetical protein
VTARNNRRSNPGQDFQLPPNISVIRQPMPGGIAYVFRDVELGELGRLAVESAPDGQTRLTSEVAGHPGDPMMSRRIELLEPLCRELSGILESVYGPGRGPTPPLPVRPPRPTGQLPVKEVRCEQCGRMVALLVFDDGATDDGRFEDCARMMYPHLERHNVPAWIIGPELGGGPMKRRPANILKVWPQREPMECLRPDEFNPRLEELVARHCHPRIRTGK